MSVKFDNIFSISGLYTAFKMKFDQTFLFAGERHNFYEFVIVVDGKIGVTAESEVLMLEKGQAILHAPMHFHSLWSEGGTTPTVIFFSFKADGVPEYSSRIFHVEDISVPLEILDLIQSGFVMRDIHVDAITNTADFKYRFAVKKLELFLLEALSQNPGKSTAVKSRSAINFSVIMHILENNIDKNLSVTDIAQMCNMSENTVKKTFSKYSGMGIMHYFNNLKITAGISMLQEGLSVKETARLLGFEDQSYFSTVFKRITGYSPRSYKMR